MIKPLAMIAGQAALYGLFAATIGYFSSAPPYRHLAPEQSLVKLSFSHQGQLLSDCRKRSAEELAKLAPNMRAAMDCPRRRSPVIVEIDLDGAPLFRGTAPPSGLSGDGASTMYQRFVVAAGTHQLTARLSDSVREPGFRYVRDERLALAPGRVLVIDFDPGREGIVFR